MSRQKRIFIPTYLVGNKVNMSLKVAEREDREIKRRLGAGQMSSIPLKPPKVFLKQSSLNLLEILGT